jgi:hypothetical protein
VSLHRYWFRFDLTLDDRHPSGVLAGCGITAFSYDDALQILRERVFKDQDVPPITERREDVDVSSLDQGHVVPNMMSPDKRGVWFPQGYE